VRIIAPAIPSASGRFAAELLVYEEVPRELAEKIAAARAAEKQE